ncbi:MAG: hypothetical protein KBT32_00990 [Bacteroidales bacterium]|nr:hypothetical protein [Candidatus Physcocola equi]
MKIYRQKKYSASIPGQLKKIQKLEGIYAMNINQRKNPLSKEMSDLAYRIAREKDVYRQKFRKKVGINRDIENNLKQSGLENSPQVISQTKKRNAVNSGIKKAEEKLAAKGYRYTTNHLDGLTAEMNKSLKSQKFRSNRDFISEAENFDHRFKKDSKKISNRGRYLMERSGTYHRGTPQELNSPEFYLSRNISKENAQRFAQEVPNYQSDSVMIYRNPQTGDPIYTFHNKCHKFEQAIIDSHEYGHLLNREGHHPEHLRKERAANQSALEIADTSGASIQSIDEMERILKKQEELTKKGDIIDNYVYYGRR